MPGSPRRRFACSRVRTSRPPLSLRTGRYRNTRPRPRILAWMCGRMPPSRTKSSPANDRFARFAGRHRRQDRRGKPDNDPKREADELQTFGQPPITPCRVALGGYPPRAPTDPDVRDFRIRLVRSTVHTRRYTEWTTRAAGSGYRSSRPHRLAHPKQPFQLRRESHFRQTRATMALIRDNEAQFPVTP